MVEEPEQSTKGPLAKVILRGVRIRSWAKRGAVPQRTVYGWAANPTVRIEVDAAHCPIPDHAGVVMTRRCEFEVSRITALASDSKFKSVQRNVLKMNWRKGRKISHFFPSFSRLQKRPKRRVKVMAYWPL